MNHNFRKNDETFSNFGFSSILLMFIMICITIFSVLSLVTAHADYNLSKKVADNTTDYYEADAKAQDVLKALDLICSTSYAQSQEADSDATAYYFDSVTIKAMAYEEFPIDCQATNNGLTLSYEIPINSSQNLDVSIEIGQPSQQSSSFYTIKTWQVVTTEEEGNTSLNVIQ